MNKLQYLEGKPHQPKLVSRRLSILVELEFRDVGFCGRRKNPGSKARTLQQSQRPYDTGTESNSGHIGGRLAHRRTATFGLRGAVINFNCTLFST